MAARVDSEEHDEEISQMTLVGTAMFASAKDTSMSMNLEDDTHNRTKTPK